MKAVVLTKFGTADKAFSIQERPMPKAKAGEVCIKVEAFGLNFADVMARRGLYNDCPPLPTVLGYEAVGRIHELGAGVEGLEVGQRVTGFTRFGGYAEYVTTVASGVAVIPDTMDVGVAAAIPTQYGTAYFCAEEMVRMHKGDHILIQAAAGGVGTALVQLAKNKGCIVYGTAGSDKKLEYLREQGVDHPINYNTTDFEEYVKKVRGEEGIDVAFDSIGGQSVKKARRLLTKGGGRIVCYGAASRSAKGMQLIADIKLLMGFGLIKPIPMLMNSQAFIGVNMLRVGDHRPESLKRCLVNVVEQVNEGLLTPTVGGRFNVDEIDKAHDFLEGRKSIGKIVVSW